MENVLKPEAQENGKNQTFARAINQRLVIDLLEEESKSCTELANILNLSNTAIAKIVGELEEIGVVKRDNIANKKIDTREKNSLGRKPILYKVNEDFGITVVINLRNCTISINDMAGKVLLSEKFNFPFEELNAKNVELIVCQLKNIIGNESIANKKLLAICIVAFGIIEPDTNEFIYIDRMQDYKNINLKKIFEKNFNVNVTVINDTRVLLIAEVKYGLLKDIDTNAAVINVTDGVSVAYLLDKKIYCGNHGGAGELGMISLGKNTILEERASKLAIIERVKKELNNNNITEDEIVDRYLKEDESVITIVDETAKVLAVIIKNLMQILDIDVVISGDIVRFKDRYINIIKEEIDKYSYLRGTVSYSPLYYKEALDLGGNAVATEQGMDSVLRNKRV